MSEKKLTKGVSAQINLPARRSATMKMVKRPLPTANEATKQNANVPTMIPLRTLSDRYKFIATLVARVEAKSRAAVFV